MEEIISFEETELRLGLPGGGGIRASKKNEYDEEEVINDYSNVNGKRQLAQTVDLKLNLSSSSAPVEKNLLLGSSSPPAKAQVVGWPPVRSFRKNILGSRKSNNSMIKSDEEKVVQGGGASLVKVSMDGAPYLRKVDLNMYKTYEHLSDALAHLFSSFTIGKYGERQGIKDFMNERKLMDLLNGCDYIPTYEDKDGDWMLVGDVPWEMFVHSCKRIRIIKGAEAIGLAPRAMEKRKNRS